MTIKLMCFLGMRIADYEELMAAYKREGIDPEPYYWYINHLLQDNLMRLLGLLIKENTVLANMVGLVLESSGFWLGF